MEMRPAWLQNKRAFHLLTAILPFEWSPNGQYLIYTPYLSDSTAYYGFNVATSETITIIANSNPIYNMESAWSGDGYVFHTSNKF